MKYIKKIIPPVCFLLLVGILLNLCSAILRPSRTSYGAVWDPILAEADDSLDYLYLGSSYAYCDINPALIYDSTALTGHVVAGPEQTMSISYYYLKEVLKSQSPEVVIIEASSLHFNEYQAYSQINVGYMPLTLNKLGAIFDGAESDLWAGLFCDLYFYHDRWTEVTPGDVLRAITPATTDYLKGYTPVDGVCDLEGAPFRRDNKADEVYQENFADLCKILDLCISEGITPVVMFHPTYSQLSEETYAQIGSDLSVAYPQLLYCNWSNDMEAFGLDSEAYFYDAGHLNQDGATLFAPIVGDFLVDTLGVTPREQTPSTSAQWEESVAYFSP